MPDRAIGSVSVGGTDKFDATMHAVVVAVASACDRCVPGIPKEIATGQQMAAAKLCRICSMPLKVAPRAEETFRRKAEKTAKQRMLKYR